METPFARTERLLGVPAMERLSKSRVILFGVGGVGGHCAEALARCGVGQLVLVDGDVVTLTNLNRQMVALHSTLGAPKVEVMRGRILDINPQARVEAVFGYYRPEETLGIWERQADLVIDAIDMVTSKVDLIARAQARGIDCVSSMGAAGKLDPTRFEAADLFETAVCPLCRATRRLARDRGIRRLRVVYSRETPMKAQDGPAAMPGEKPGSIAYVTAAAGLVLASEAIRMLLSDREEKVNKL